MTTWSRIWFAIHRALLRSASGRWVKQKFAPASLWPQSSAMVQRRRGRSGSRHNSKWCWGLCRFFLSIRPQMLRTAGFEHSLSGSANRSAATTCSSLLMLLRLVIPWLATTQGSLLWCEAYNERTGFVPLKGKILKGKYSSYLTLCSPRECQRATKVKHFASLLESDRGGSRTHAIGDEHYQLCHKLTQSAVLN